jgi:hypothetical protein
VSKARAISEVRAAVAAGRVLVTEHASDRMLERRVSIDDVLRVLSTTLRFESQGDGSWLARGPIDARRLLAVVLTIEEGVVVISVWKESLR